MFKRCAGEVWKARDAANYLNAAQGVSKLGK